MKILAVSAVVVAVAAVAALGVILWPRTSAGPVGKQATLAVSGSVTVKGEYPAVQTDNELTCVTGGGYDDVREGAQVVVSDGSARTVALGKLGYGSWTRGVGCVFLFKVADVPAGHKFYGVEVAHRGRLQYTAAELAAPLKLSIG